jgi:hypothetical protein
MKKISLFLIFIFPLTVVSHAQQIQYLAGNGGWNADSLGNHRFLAGLTPTEYAKNKKIVRVTIPWRRHDSDPGKKRIIVVDAGTNRRVLNAVAAKVDREYGELFFEPVSGAGKYYVYYMPYKSEGRSNYPTGVYLKPDTTASPEWINALHHTSVYSVARAIAYEAVDTFNSFYPMEFIATSAETKKMVQQAGNSALLVFPEDRMHPICMRPDLPERWVHKNYRKGFSGEVKRGENFSFQLGLYTLQELHDVKLVFSDIKTASGNTITSKNLSCYNTDGVTYDGSTIHPVVNIAKGDVQPLWCGATIPGNAVPGIYKGRVLVIANSGSVIKEIALILNVKNETAVDGGTGEPQKMTRLPWLNSTLAQENTVISPYTPLTVEDSTIGLLGRKIILHNDGFPRQVESFFTPEMTSIGATPTGLFIEPLHFHFYDANGKQPLHWKNGGVQFTKKEAGTVAWQATNVSEALQMDVSASLEFDGFLSYFVRLTALQDMAFNDINFHLPFQPEVAKYLMGLGLKGGLRPDSLLWKWDVAHKNQDGAWIGDVNAGIQFSFRDEHYVRPLNTNFYLQKPLVLPASWGNGNKGGIEIFKKGSSVLVNAYSGSRMMKKSDVLYYNFNLLITPFHSLNTDFQWATRFYHKYNNLDTIRATGATVVNIHHATPINPWINYPFIEREKMKAYIDEAHSKGLKVKIYNTVRELSNRAYELFALRSLGHEIYSPGRGGGFSWLQEHAGDDYIAAWFVPEIKDAAIVNSGMSRWHNYYVEGMNWLVNNVGIDGIYLDDVAFDRVTMKRIKRVLTQNGHPGIIDLHSANQYNKNDGFNNSANLYMEHFPYLNRLWFGEYFDYEKNSPDFYLTEVSGIPFGLMGEMLQGGGNPWRGLIYGMTNRMPWSDNADPRPIWKAWDDFGIRGTEMIGYWSSDCPVKTDNNRVLATVYKKQGAAMVSIASWADDDTSVKLLIDWKTLGIDPAIATITAPEINNFQPGAVFSPVQSIPVKKGRGWLLVIKQ